MAFWSGETLANELKTLIEPFDPKKIDCAAYTLSIGNEVYVSPTHQALDPNVQTKMQLAPNQAFAIPPGQFAFLLTLESVSVPPSALALISMKAKIKFRGLVNVSGFHVDPGYRGQLVFSVFNASPTSIHLQQGQSCFLIWYSSLDSTSKEIKTTEGLSDIPTELINTISGEIQSLAGLAIKIKDSEKKLNDKIGAVEKEQASAKTLLTVLMTIAFAISAGAIKLLFDGYTFKPAQCQVIEVTKAIQTDSGKSEKDAPTARVPASPGPVTTGKK